MGTFVGGQQMTGIGVLEPGAKVLHVNPPQLAQAKAAGSICTSAADAASRNSPVAPQLAKQCLAWREATVRGGVYVPDALNPDDGAYRNILERAGELVVSRDPKLSQMRAQIPAEANGELQQRRGFTIAQGVRNGNVDPAFIGWFAASIARSPALAKGFNDAINAPADFELDQATGGRGEVAEESAGIPRPVLIAGGAVAVLGLAAVIFKLTRR